MFSRLRVTLALLAGLVVACALPAALAAPQPERGPSETIAEATEAFLKAVDQHREQLARDPARIEALINETILPVVDFDRFSRLILGKFYRRATPEQRAAFQREFQRLLLDSYATAVVDHRGIDIRFLRTRLTPDGDDGLVQTRISSASGRSATVDYRVYAGSRGWQVYDVIVEGISAVITFRKSFYPEIQRQGLDRFIATLGARDLPGSAPRP